MREQTLSELANQRGANGPSNSIAVFDKLLCHITAVAVNNKQPLLSLGFGLSVAVNPKLLFVYLVSNVVKWMECFFRLIKCT